VLWNALAIVFTVLCFIFWLWCLFDYKKRKKTIIKTTKNRLEANMLLFLIPFISLISCILFIFTAPADLLYWLVFFSLGIAFLGVSLEYINIKRKASYFINSFSSFKTRLIDYLKLFGLDLATIAVIGGLLLLWTFSASASIEAAAGANLDPNSPDFGQNASAYAKRIISLLALAVVFALLSIIISSFIKTLIWKIVYKVRPKKQFVFLSKYTFALFLWNIMWLVPVIFLMAFTLPLANENPSLLLKYLMTIYPLVFFIISYFTLNFNAAFCSSQKVWKSIGNAFAKGVLFFPRLAGAVVMAIVILSIINSVFAPLKSIAWTGIIFGILLLAYLAWTRFYFAMHLEDLYSIKQKL